MPVIASQSNELKTWTLAQLGNQKAALDLENLQSFSLPQTEEAPPMIVPRLSHDSSVSNLTYRTAESVDEAKLELQELKGKLMKIKEKKDQESLGS